MQLYVLNHPFANQVPVLITLLGCFPFHPGALGRVRCSPYGWQLEPSQLHYGKALNFIWNRAGRSCTTHTSDK